MAKAVRPIKRIEARFYQTSGGREPVRDWLLEMDDADRKIIGDDIRTAEFGWPIGMPICRPLTGRVGLWEIRSNLTGGRIARVLFCIQGNQMVLLHGMVKKTQKTPTKDLDLADRRKKELDS